MDTGSVSGMRVNGAEEQTAEVLGNNVSSLENKLLKLYSADEAEIKKAGGEKKWLESKGIKGYSTLEGAQQAFSIKYQKAVKALEAFMTLMKSAFDTAREAIRNLRVG
jgi:hypothetical protein